MADEMEVEKVGDSSTNRLANYQRCARELLRSALLEQPSIARQRAPTPTELRRRKEELLHKQIEAAVELELRRQLSIQPLGSVSISEDEAYVDAVKLRLNALEKELLTVKCDYVKNCRLLECLQEGQVLREKLFYGENSDIHKSLDRTFSGEGFSDFSGRLIECDTARQLTQQSELSGELLKELEEIKTIRSELLSVKRERRKLQQQARKLMKIVQDFRRSQTPSELNDDDTEESDSCGGSASSQLHRAESELSLLRGTLQGLIAGSKVPWNKDNKLMELTLKLGDDKQWR